MLDKRKKVCYTVQALIRECSSMVEFQPSKLAAWVRFPSLAPSFLKRRLKFSRLFCVRRFPTCRSAPFRPRRTVTHHQTLRWDSTAKCYDRKPQKGAEKRQSPKAPAKIPRAAACLPPLGKMTNRCGKKVGTPRRKNVKSLDKREKIVYNPNHRNNSIH